MAEDSKVIVQRFLEALWDSRRTDAKACLALNAEWWFLPSLGYERPMLARLAVDSVLDDMMPEIDPHADFSVELHMIFAEGPYVVAEYTARGRTIRGSVYENRYCLRADVEDGLIISVRPFTDTSYFKTTLLGETAK